MNGDGKLVEIDETQMSNMKYSDVADKDMATRMKFWKDVFEKTKYEIASAKAIVRIDFC